MAVLGYLRIRGARISLRSKTRRISPSPATRRCLWSTVSSYRSTKYPADGCPRISPNQRRANLFEIKDEKDLAFARDAALLVVNGFVLPVDKVSSGWLSSDISESEAREWLGDQRREGSRLRPRRGVACGQRFRPTGRQSIQRMAVLGYLRIRGARMAW